MTLTLSSLSPPQTHSPKHLKHERHGHRMGQRDGQVPLNEVNPRAGGLHGEVHQWSQIPHETQAKRSNGLHVREEVKARRR